MNQDGVHASIERATSISHRIIQCELILTNATAFANERWNNVDSCFSDSPKLATGVHIVNTSTALITIAHCPECFKRGELKPFNEVSPREVCSFYDRNYKPAPHPSRGYWESRETKSWSPYVSALVLRAISSIAITYSSPAERSDLVDKFNRLKDILPEQAQGLAEYLREWAAHQLTTSAVDYNHPFFAYTALEALSAASDAWGHRLPDVSDCLKASQDLALNRMQLDLYTQMTFRLSGLSQHLDVSALALSTYTVAKYALMKEPGPKVPEDVIHAALETIVNLQNKGGTWDTSVPLLGSATGQVGCSSMELAICLLRICSNEVIFKALMPAFDGIAEMLLRNYDSKCPTRGWPTDLHRNGSNRQTWYSFIVYEFLYLFTRRARRYAASVLLSTFRVRQISGGMTWDRLADFRDYKIRLKDRMIKSWDNSIDKRERCCSAILFGPPGTGKTSIGEALASELHWPLIEIGPGDFLQDGVDGIFANGDRVFQRLLLLENVVVLFDEVDELVVERRSETDTINRFLTTYMLPWLQRLRDRAELIFIFATNQIDRYDAAIRRHGRFDLILPVGPPDGIERGRVIAAILRKRGLEPSTKFIDLIQDALVVPPQATIGDILRIYDRLTSLQREDRDVMINAFAAANLLIKEHGTFKEWSQFIDHCEKFKS